MSNAVGAAVTAYPKTFSIGPLKIQLFNVAFISGDTTCTLTADTMSTVYWSFLTGVTQTAAPTYATNVATFTFTNPAASVFGQGIAFGV